jgi:hypothetical protein
MFEKLMMSTSVQRARSLSRGSPHLVRVAAARLGTGSALRGTALHMGCIGIGIGYDISFLANVIQ